MILTRDQVLSAIRSRRSQLTALGVGSLALIGSAARDELRPDSDVDVLIEYARPVGLEVVDIKKILEEAVQRPVDLVHKKTVYRLIRDQVLAESIPI
jgi:uncharacterized protein